MRYTYPLSAFPNGKINFDSLIYSIQKSAIVTALDYNAGMSGDGGTGVAINFMATLSDADKTILDSIVTVHTGVPIVPEILPQPVSFLYDNTDATGNLFVNPRPVSGTLNMNFVYVTVGQNGVYDFGGDANWSYAYTPTQTTLTYAPPFGYYIDGGGFQMLANSTIGPIKAKVAIAPLIPANMGGNKVIVNNKLLVPSEQFSVQVPPKYVQYIHGVPANMTQIVLSHIDTENSRAEFYIRIYV